MSDKTPSSLSKICSSCGLEKPLSAFLELSGEAAGTYGNICGTCRKAHIEKLKSEKSEGGSRTETGDRIDAKARVAGEIDKKQTTDKVDEEYHAERDENEVVESGLLEKKDLRLKDERKHRETFLGHRFKVDKTKSQDPSKTHVAAQEEIRDKENVTEQGRDEKKKTEINLAAPVLDTYVPGQKRFEGVAIRYFATLAGKGSAIGARLGSKQEAPAAKDANKAKDQTLSDYIENTWGPKKR